MLSVKEMEMKIAKLQEWEALAEEAKAEAEAKAKAEKEARAKAYAATEWIHFDNKYMRSDIGKAIDEA